ncbi:hypothetical protein Pres01_07130 [Metapseudomonas resinovorans]|uniref:hypothetical protein n=1 Tax=Metapseudomonas resinovorans TaxID=53412 RepID=UPI000986932E|nr:hypothetical protein [Pseudomonas resinovorans]GLZ84662.1 hypothetical protein Pres01_07130 [Pseudomonas resinovorans]
MKSAISTTAFSSLLFSLVALTSFQATAEGGSDRLIQYQELQAQRGQTTEDESERFAQLVEEKPTAAGSATTTKAAEPAQKSRYQSRIHHRPVVYE